MPDQHQLDGRKVLGCKCWFFYRRATLPLELTRMEVVKSQHLGNVDFKTIYNLAR